MGLSAAGRDCIGGGGRGGSAVAEGGGGDGEEGGVGGASHFSEIRGRDPAERRICGVVGEVEVRLKPWRRVEGRSFRIRRFACVLADEVEMNAMCLVVHLLIL